MTRRCDPTLQFRHMGATPSTARRLMLKCVADNERLSFKQALRRDEWRWQCISRTVAHWTHCLLLFTLLTPEPIAQCPRGWS